MQKIYLLSFIGFLANILSAQNTVDFENFELPLDTFLNDNSGANFQSGSASFPNSFNPDFGGFWESGWAISTMRDDNTSGFGNLYSAIAGSGQASNTYAVGQQSAIIRLKDEFIGKVVNGIYITNTTYSHNSMRDGDMFAKKFGGADGTEPDFFKLEVRKYSNGTLQPEAIEFYLADFRFEEDSLDYIVNDWQWVDLTSLGNIDSLQFILSSSDLGDYGINTPLFFAIDKLEISEEISTSNENLFFNQNQLTVFPNPAIAEIYLDLGTARIERALVFDINGKLLLESQQTNRLDVSSLKKGTYVVKTISNKGQQKTKLIFKQ